MSDSAPCGLEVARCRRRSTFPHCGASSPPTPGGASPQCSGSVPAFVRAFGGYEKGAFYYLHNHLFWAKMGLLAARISFVQALLVVLMVLAATAMARGYGVPAR